MSGGTKAAPSAGAFVPPGLRRAVKLLDLGFDDALVDLRSLVEALGMAWLRWDIHAKARATAWGVAATAAYGYVGCFVPAATVPRWLAEVHDLLPARAAKRAERLRLGWRDAFNEFLEAELPHIAARRRAAPVGRKIGAETVRILYEQRQSGAVWPVAAAAAGIAISVAKGIGTGRYVLSDAAQAEWDASFGATRPKRRSV